MISFLVYSLWKEAAALLGGNDALDADGHSGDAMGDFLGSGALEHSGEGPLEDAEEAVGDFGFAPEEVLQVLDPFEVGDDDAAGVAKDVRDDEDFFPSLEKDLVGIRGGGAVGGLGEDAALET